MNSILQCLSNTQELRDYCLMNFHRTDLSNNSTVSTALMEGQCSIHSNVPIRFKSVQNTCSSTYCPIPSFMLWYQSLQNWPRAFGLQSISMPSVHQTLGVRSKNARLSLWAACKWLACCSSNITVSPDSPVPRDMLSSVNRMPRSFCAVYWTAFTPRLTGRQSTPKYPLMTWTNSCELYTSRVN